MPSPYQDDLFASLAGSEGIELRVIFARELATNRVRLGWKRGAHDYEARTLSSPYAIDEAIALARRERNSLHLVNGIWAEPSFAAALSTLACLRSKFVIHSERPENPYAPNPFKRLMRMTFGTWITRHAVGVLAISRLARDYYIQLGCPEHRLYPFGYFRAQSHAAPFVARRSRREVSDIVFVGQLIRRKGVDLLLDAIAPLFAEHHGLRLTLIGDGDHRGAFESQVHRYGLHDRVVFEGALAADRIQSRMATADLLVLPSRWDGWGIVINEALSGGVPVVASDLCGAADLIEHGVNGYVFPANNAISLRECLRCYLNHQPEQRVEMSRAAEATGRCVEIGTASRYLIDCLMHMLGELDQKPKPPWMRRVSFAVS